MGQWKHSNECCHFSNTARVACSSITAFSRSAKRIIHFLLVRKLRLREINELVSVHSGAELRLKLRSLTAKLMAFVPLSGLLPEIQLVSHFKLV